jgi:hypothetical protein
MSAFFRHFTAELLKLSVDISKIPPEALWTPPQPFMGDGYQKATQAIQGAAQFDAPPEAKQASDPRYTERVKGDNARNAAIHTVAGAGTGRLISEVAGAVKLKHKNLATGAGALLGLGNYAYRRHQLKKLSTVFSPAASLKSTQSVGRMSQPRMPSKTGPSLKQEVPLIGRVGTLPQ